MTDEARRANVALELRRADESRRAAETLLAAGLLSDAISRAYYAAFHLIRALLVSRGLEPRSHAGAFHLFNVELVSRGLLPTTLNRTLAGLQRAREIADYDAAVVFAAEDGARYLDEVRAFEKDVVALLRSEGWLAAES